MRIRTIILIIITSLFIYGCSKKIEYLNETESCELKLYDDSMYKFSYPTFFETKSEKGFYEIGNDKITLSRKSYNKIDSVDIGYTYSWNGTDKPDSLLLRFKEVIKAKIKFNSSIQEFESNELGEINIAYKKLENLGIIESNEVIKNYTIYFDNKIYSPDMSNYLDSRRPQKIDFKLNQFVGEEYAILKRVYRFENDTIYMNDISRKTIGRNNKLTKLE